MQWEASWSQEVCHRELEREVSTEGANRESSLSAVRVKWELSGRQGGAKRECSGRQVGGQEAGKRMLEREGSTEGAKRESCLRSTAHPETPTETHSETPTEAPSVTHTVTHTETEPMTAEVC